MSDFARIARKVINLDAGGDRKIVCCWDDCGRDGVELHKLLLHDHDERLGCRAADAKVIPATGHTAHRWAVFCSDRHRLFFANSQGRAALRSIESTGRAYGNLPVGSRGTIL